MPWRNTHDPYKILVSEVMLQQTQVSRALKKYPEFIEAFPDVKSLAKAPLKRILSVWQGMGYNRRAIRLQQAARVVIGLVGGIPHNPEDLEKLPGIGKNTAGAIVAFAFNMPSVFIETNIRRVFIYHFFKNRRNIHDNEIFPLVEKTLDKKNPREWYWALMDYGSALPKIATNPNRKSKHYIKQKPFKGSNREVRGLILHILLEKGSLSAVKLRAQIDRPRLRKNLDDLIREGFLKRQRNAYTLVN